MGLGKTLSALGLIASSLDDFGKFERLVEQRATLVVTPKSGMISNINSMFQVANFQRSNCRMGIPDQKVGVSSKIFLPSSYSNMRDKATSTTIES
jgi:hypothetical protein